MTSALARKIVPETVPAATGAPMPIVIVGHVDHGKSTLVGRIIHDTGALPEGKEAQLREACLRRGMPFEWSFLLDALQAERDQGITIDTTRIGFRTDARGYVIIDAPGHKEFLKNMISGAASAEAALLIIDASEGVKEQSMRHGYLLHLLGIRQIAVIVGKMDKVGYSEEVFRRIEQDYRAYLKSVGVTPTFVIPVSAREGVNITPLLNPPPQGGRKTRDSGIPSPLTGEGQGGGAKNESNPMPWYTGPSVTEALDRFTPAPTLDHLPLRFPIQDIYKFDDRRIFAGRIESGSLAVGDEILLSPSNKRAKVASIETWPTGKKTRLVAGESGGITLSDQLFAERGHIISHAATPPLLTNIFRARVFWLAGKPLTEGKRYRLRLMTSELVAEVKEIEQVVDTGTLAHRKSAHVENGAVAEVVFRVRGMAGVDSFADNARTGRFVILDDYDICGGGIIDLTGFPDQRVKAERVTSQNITAVDLRITPESRALANGHTGGILWFTGLSGSGKSTLALELQQRLFAKGYQVYVLDGDNIRGGLNRDLGFAASDRSENIRRAGEVAALFASAGTIVITSFISPYNEDRKRARLAAPDFFNMVHIRASLETCETRDVKGLYSKARKGEIREFTGVSAPYEAPTDADLVVDTAALSVDESVSLLMDYVKKQFVEPVKAMQDQLAGGI